MLDFISEPALTALVGLIGGIVLGLAARIGRFCTLGAIEDAYSGESTLRLRMWGIAIGVAIICTFTLSAAGLLELDQTLYLSQCWNPAASVAGGLLFGYGMALAGNCGYGALARVGGGDLRSFLIVLIMGIAAYMTLGGPFAEVRLWIFGSPSPATSMPSLAQGLSDLTSLGMNSAGIALGATLVLLTCLSRNVRTSSSYIIWGAIVGLAIASGWAGTRWVATNGFGTPRVVSHTFSAPLGETIIYTMTSSGNTISFGTGSVVGVVLGAFIGSLFKGQFRWESCDDPRELRRQLLGAFIMGIGAVVAVGCSVGQGLSAFSVLAYSAPVTFGCIMLGAALGLRQLIWGFGPRI
jgi:uncharacterized membrane protein YedE/YeeE